MEYIRSLPYDSVGTIGGIPSGVIPQNATTTLNGILYHERVLIANIDSSDDGVGAADTNGILADYKEVKIEYSWSGLTGTNTIALDSNVSPPGIESTAGGGTLLVNVFDSAVQPVSGALVHVYNNTTTSTIDTTRYTDTSGQAVFAGAPAAANYQINVTDTGYSTDQTYVASSTNPNPSPPPAAVVKSAISTMNFQIDELSDLTIKTVGPASSGSFTDGFVDMSKIATANNTESNGSALILSGGAGSYVASGDAISTSTSPALIQSWDKAAFTVTAPANTSALVSVYAVTGTSTPAYTLVPNADLPGNSAGFASGPIDLSGLDVSAYPRLALKADFTTSDSNKTPELNTWGLSYTISEPSIGSVPFMFTGSKTIGTTAGGVPIYKYKEVHSTDASGEVTLTNLEWDSYDVTLNTSSYDIAQACNDIPYALDAGVDETLKLTLVPPEPQTLRVSVDDIGSNPVQGARVDIGRTGFSDSATTTSCGQVFFNNGLVNATDYQVDISAPGYTNKSVSDVEVSGNSALVVTLTP
jgi:hypothetical protein